MRCPFRGRRGSSDEFGIARRVAVFPGRSTEHYGVSQGWSFLVQNGYFAIPILVPRTSPSTSVLRQERPPQQLGGCSALDFREMSIVVVWPILRAFWEVG